MAGYAVNHKAHLRLRGKYKIFKLQPHGVNLAQKIIIPCSITALPGWERTHGESFEPPEFPTETRVATIGFLWKSEDASPFIFLPNNVGVVLWVEMCLMWYNVKGKRLALLYLQLRNKFCPWSRDSPWNFAELCSRVQAALGSVATPRLLLLSCRRRELVCQRQRIDSS